MNKLYTKDHFWLEKIALDSPLRGAILPRLEQENLYIFCATQYGIDALGDVVAVDVYQGNYKSMEMFGTIESRKACVELTLAANFTVIRQNPVMNLDGAKYLQSLYNNPEQVWIALVEINDKDFPDSCMTKDAYEAFCK